MKMSINAKLFDYISNSPTPYHAIAHTAALLEQAGYTRLGENKEWTLNKSGKYFTTRNASSLMAFRVPEAYSGYMMTAAHCDTPCFKIKDNAELCDSFYVRLSGEKYGGMLCSTWLDRPLSIAGRVAVSTPDGIEMKLVDLKAPAALIPNVAIHMNRNANDAMTYNAAVDMLALWGADTAKGSFKARIADAAGAQAEDIIAQDLFLYNTERGVEWGDFISAPRLDDLQCAYASLSAFLDSKESNGFPVFCLFDNEEVGSQTKQGAASTFLPDTLDRIGDALGLSAQEKKCKIANSMLLSCDNAHAIHPNHPEYSDKNHTVRLNGGIVIKHNANQRYTTDAVSAALFRKTCASASVATQDYANRADMPGGSTLGNIANTQVSLNTIDIGLAQLAMHSSFETAGAADTQAMTDALTCFFECSIEQTDDGSYTIG